MSNRMNICQALVNNGEKMEAISFLQKVKRTARKNNITNC
ncbi:hypothetical protein [Klebsiella pneumoniae IS10]|nr:hypothetical protein [Klebsiella pneumoniae IS10]